MSQNVPPRPRGVSHVPTFLRQLYLIMFIFQPVRFEINYYLKVIIVIGINYIGKRVVISVLNPFKLSLPGYFKSFKPRCKVN